MKKCLKLILGMIISFSFYQSFGQENSFMYYSKQHPYPDAGFGDCIVKLIMNKNTDTVNLLYFKRCDALDGVVEYYLVGKKVDEYTILGIKDDKFKIVFSQDFKLARCEFEWYGQFHDNIDLFQAKPKYTFKKGLRNLRESPDLSSKIISKIDPNKSNAEVIEIGKPQEIGKMYEFWYKIKINNFEGWIFGGLELFGGLETVDYNVK